MSKVLTATDLLQMGYRNDPLLLEDVSLCTMCTYSCFVCTASRLTEVVET